MTEGATAKDNCHNWSVRQLIFMYVIYRYCSLVWMFSSCDSPCASSCFVPHSLYSLSSVFLYHCFVLLMDAHVAFLLTAFRKFWFFWDFLFRPLQKENHTIARKAANLRIWVAESWECSWISGLGLVRLIIRIMVSILIDLSSYCFNNNSYQRSQTTFWRSPSWNNRIVTWSCLKQRGLWIHFETSKEHTLDITELFDTFCT